MTTEDQSPQTEIPAFFGELKKLREEKNITLEQIAADTRISLEHLQALEKGDLENVPSVYDKMFFRTYLRALNVEIDRYFDAYLEYRSENRTEKTTIIQDFSEEEELGKKYYYKNLLVFLPIIAAVILIWLLINFTQMVDEPSMQPVEEIKLQELIPDTSIYTVPEKEIARIETPVVHKLRLNVIGLKRTWLRLVTDRKDTSEYMLLRGNEIEFSADSLFEFLIGRADGVEFEFGGKKIGALGDSTQVIRYLAINSEGIIARRLGVPIKKREVTGEN